MKKVNRLTPALACATLLLFAASCSREDLPQESTESAVPTDGVALDSDVASATTTTTPTALYRINAGGVQVNTSIGTFLADQKFSAGAALTRAVDITNTTDDALYQTERYGSSFGYALPVSNGTYTVKLHFADNWVTSVGVRKFDVNLENTRVLDNYDIFAKVGTRKAVVETFTVNVADGTLNINFSSLATVGGANNATVSGIEVLGGSSPTPTPIPTEPTTANLTFDNKFESTSAFPTNVNATVNGLYNESARVGLIALNTQLKREGNASVRFELTKADAAKYSSSDPNRFNYTRSELGRGAEASKERWYGMSTFFPSDYIADRNDETVMQWRGAEDNATEAGRNPAIQLITYNDRFIVKVRYSADPINTKANSTEKQFDLGPITKNGWIDWVFHIKFSYGSDGVLEVWKNKQKVINYLGPNSYNDQRLPYFKFGIYKWNWDNAAGRAISPEDRRVLYFDALRIGNANATFAEVSPR